MRALPVLGLSLLTLLSACGTQGSSGTPTTTQEAQMPTTTEPAAASPSDPREYSTQGAALLDDLVSRFSPADAEELEQGRTASTIACTMGGPGGSTAWIDQSRFAVKGNLEDAVAGAATALEGEGWARVEQANAGRSVTLERRGWLTVMSWVPDAQTVHLSVESPCVG